MSGSPFALPAAPTVQVSAALEPVPDLLLSLWALTTAAPVAVERDHPERRTAQPGSA